MSTQVKPYQIIIMVSGFVALISGFLAWYSVDLGDFGGGSSDANAFDEGLFPIATYIPLIGLALGVLVAIKAFGNVNFPEKVLGFTWTQIHLVLTAFAGLLAIGYLIMDTRGADRGIGLWLAILASIGLVAGTVMEYMDNEEVAAAGSGSTPPTPF